MRTIIIFFLLIIMSKAKAQDYERKTETQTSGWVTVNNIPLPKPATSNTQIKSTPSNITKPAAIRQSSGTNKPQTSGNGNNKSTTTPQTSAKNPKNSKKEDTKKVLDKLKVSN